MVEVRRAETETSLCEQLRPQRNSSDYPMGTGNTKILLDILGTGSKIECRRDEYKGLNMKRYLLAAVVGFCCGVVSVPEKPTVEATDEIDTGNAKPGQGCDGELKP